jgi:hypothetical protein
LIYVVLAIVVAVAAAFAVERLAFPNNYSLSVVMKTNNTATMYPYQTSRLTVQVNNTGMAQVQGLVVGIYLNGTELKYYTVTLPSRRGVTLVYNYTYIASGTFAFQAVADPGRLLNIANRSSAQGSVNVDVKPPEAPNVYETVPNNGISETQSFTLSEAGIYSASAVAQAYNLTIVDNMFSTSRGVLAVVLDDVYGFVASAFGATAEYNDGASAYVLWMQGTLEPGLVNYVVSTFRVPQSASVINGTKTSFARLGNQTSMCTFYSGGWTKILVYYNNSLNSTCLSVLRMTYTPSESAAIVIAHNNSGALMQYQSRFEYSDANVIGSSLTYTNQSVGGINLFQDAYGFFMSYVRRLSHASARNMTCYGLVYDKNNTSACSYIVPPSVYNASQTFGIVNTTEIAGNYILTVYSLVNDSNLFAAHMNAALLMGTLKVNSSVTPWVAAFKNTCAFNSSQGINCSVNGFDFVNDTANVSITNGLGAPIKITSMACHTPGAVPSYAENAIIKGGSTASIAFPCQNIPLPVSVALTSYTLAMNYTYMGKNMTANGMLNITNEGFG